MAEHPADPANTALPIQEGEDASARDPVGADEKTAAADHLETDDTIEPPNVEAITDLHKKAGIAVIRQQHTIPATGKRLSTSKWEYIFFCIFCEYRTVIQPRQRAKLTADH